MSADKQLQQVFDTQRIPLYDAMGQTKTYSTGAFSGFSEQLYWNCFPVINKNLTNSDGEVEVHKRPGHMVGYDYVANGQLTTGHVYNCVASLSIQALSSTNIYVIWDATSSQYTVLANNIVLGTIAGGPGSGLGGVSDYIYVSEITSSGLPGIAVVFQANGYSTTRAYYAITNSSKVFTAASLTVITDAYFPANLGGASYDALRGPIIQMDGYCFVMTKSGAIYSSVINDVSTWHSLTSPIMVQAIQSPDQGVGLARYKNFVLAFGSSSIEFFTNVGNILPYCALGRTEQAFTRIGAMSAKAIVQVGDDVFWMAHSVDGNLGLYKFGGGYTPVKVSNDKLTESLETQTASTYIWLQVFNDGIRQHLLTNIPVSPMLLANATYPSDPNGLLVTKDFGIYGSSLYRGWLCIDITTGSPWVWQTYVSVATGLLPVPSGQYIDGSNSTIYCNYGYCFQDPFSSLSTPSTNIGSVTGYSYNMILDDGVWTDTFHFQGTSQNFIYTAGIQFNTMDWGTEKRKRIHKFKIVQQGIHYVTPEPYTWVVYLKEPNYQDSAYPAGQTIISRPITPGTSNSRMYINNLGSGRYWSFGLAHKAAGPWRLQWLEVDISQGTS